jgi:hypothetical protein
VGELAAGTTVALTSLESVAGATGSSATAGDATEAAEAGVTSTFSIVRELAPGTVLALTSLEGVADATATAATSASSSSTALTGPDLVQETASLSTVTLTPLECKTNSHLYCRVRSTITKTDVRVSEIEVLARLQEHVNINIRKSSSRCRQREWGPRTSSERK